MAKLTHTDLTSLTNETSAVNTINANGALTEAAMENTVSRDGTTPNQMGADFDLNGNALLNVGQITYSSGSAQAGLVGPDPSVDNTIARWDGVTGLVLDDSGWTIGDTDTMTAAGTLDMSGNAQTNVLAITGTGGGAFDSNGGNILSGSGTIDSEAGIIQSGGGVIDSESGTIQSGGGLIDSEGGNLNLGGGYIIEYSEKADAESSASNAIDLDLNDGNYFYTTLSENITTLTFSNLPTTGQFASWSWEITQDSSARTITWPAAVVWSGGTAITLSTGSGAIDVVNFWTRDAGTTVYATVVGQDFS
jgi:hypothetical protein